MPASGLAAIERTPAPTAALPDKPQRISRRIQQGIALVTSGQAVTLKAAADHIGLSYWHFVRELKKPHIRVFMERKARETIAAGTMRASARLIELLDAGSEHVSADVARHVLAIAGIKPAADAQVAVNIEIKAGYVIDLSEGPRPSVTPHQRVIDVKANEINVSVPSDE